MKVDGALLRLGARGARQRRGGRGRRRRRRRRAARRAGRPRRPPRRGARPRSASCAAPGTASSAPRARRSSTATRSASFRRSPEAEMADRCQPRVSIRQRRLRRRRRGRRAARRRRRRRRGRRLRRHGARPQRRRGGQSLELEHYPGMTEASIEAMIDEATAPLRDPRRARRPPRRRARADGADRSRRRHRGASRPGVPGLRVPDGLPEDAGAVLEEGSRSAPARAGSMRAVADDAALARWGIAAGNAADAPAEG